MEVGGTSVKNKNKSSTVGKPLLYIAQVSLELAAPKIKRIILTNFENEDRKEESNRNENVVSSAVEEVIEQEQEQQEEQQVEGKIEEEEEEQVQEQQVQEQQEPVRTVPYNKSFKDMNNEERIHFLLNRPHYIPKVRCRIKTATVSYVGSIISYRNGIVAIMPPNSMRDIKLSIDDIQSISMAGF
ncbi:MULTISPECIES: spore coat CotO family protein [Bacillus]|mgnify:CR=1 FL=1|jgi:TolA-binding protein|uniref:Spore coat CotO family protein n=1 Tax=Bacillus pacificus TaxID=2026187 RepID=A0AAP5FZ11_9BACI|nr:MULTISPECIES: spore coat CotO family protein [Bacillus]MCU5157774.1 spore coat CotO family protein [Bacillus pacificus]MCU9941440.1 spore coat CotO family protein [Bacillus pacificus]MCX3302564.1 spore coat CotO family protein [Bacillus pacificus]MCX3328878.1 spore coat CotO family protein [Bacillus pacificus]MDA1690861.1 spore coat CotO family protein [Bacillus cereus group sp. TH147LC]